MKGGRRWVALVLLWGCGPSLEDAIEELGGTRDQRLAAEQELLLAKDRAVGPLLAALADTGYGAARPHLVPVLFSLSRRVESGAVKKALLQRLGDDPDPGVRAAVATGLALYRWDGAVPALVEATGDADAAVRQAALGALNQMEGLEEADERRLEARLPELLRDTADGVRAEALFRAEAGVARRVEAASQAVAKAQLAAAESLYAAAVDFSPESWQARFRQARFYYDHGQRERGLALMRRHGMVLDVPRLAGGARIDGRPDEAFWQQAATTLLHYKTNYFTASPSELESRLYLAYTDEALYVAFRFADGHIDSLTNGIVDRDGHIWTEDSAEFFFDVNLDRRSYVQFIVSSLGTVFDAVHPNGIQSQQREWTAADEVATHVGADHWSLEYRVEYDPRWLPRPRPGDVWGANFVRDYRDLVNFSQWVFTYRTVHQPDVFGLLVFE